MQYDETCLEYFLAHQEQLLPGAGGRDNGRGRGIFRGLHGGCL